MGRIPPDDATILALLSQIGEMDQDRLQQLMDQIKTEPARRIAEDLIRQSGRRAAVGNRGEHRGVG